jgi:hypothetical protein
MRRIRTAAATVMVATGLIGAVAAPASASKPEFLVEVNCASLGAPVTVVVLGSAGIQQVVGELAQECDRGTMRVSVERL